MDKGIRIHLAALIALFLVAGFFMVTPGLLFTPDASTYVILANSFFREPYHDYSIPGNPVHVLYPPAYPLMLALPALFFSESIIAAKLLTLILGAAALIGIFLVSKRIFSQKVAILITAATAVHQSFLMFSTEVMAEIPALMLAVFSIYFIQKKKAFPAGILAGAAFLGRANWLCLAPAGFLYFLFKRKTRDALVFGGISSVISIGWIVRDKIVGQISGNGGASYISQVMTNVLDPSAPVTIISLIKTVLVNIRYYSIYSLKISFSGILGSEYARPALGLPSFLSWTLACLFGLLVLAGAVYFWKRSPIIVLSLFWYFAFLSIFPYKELRYLLPLIPFFIMLAFGGLMIASKAVKRKGLLPALFFASLLIFPSAFTSFLFAGQGMASFSKDAFRDGLAAEYRYDRGNQLIAAGQWIRNNTSPNATILADRKEITLYSQRLMVSLDPISVAGTGDFDFTIWNNGVDYVITTSVLGMTPADTKLLGSFNYDFIPQVQIGSLAIFKVEARNSTRQLKRNFTGMIDFYSSYPPGFERENNLGTFNYKQGNYEEAYAHLSFAMQIDASSAQVHFNLGSVLMDLGRYDEARMEFQKALSIQFVHRLIPLIESNLRIIRIREEMSGKNITEEDGLNQIESAF